MAQGGVVQAVSTPPPQQQASPSQAQQGSLSPILRGAASTSAPKLATAVLARLRAPRKEEAVVEGMGNESVAVVMRSFSLLLQRETSFACVGQPVFAQSKEGRQHASHPSFRLTIRCGTLEEAEVTAQPACTVTVKDESTVAKVAGKIARWIRTNHATAREAVLLLQCGPSAPSINAAAKAAALARLMLERDGLDLTLHPAQNQGLQLSFFVKIVKPTLVRQIAEGNPM
eukprot:TRINITY_DN1923_c0_g1_i1.p1 TRINITY_DN1923_c0_g1~~TRINITY_DN1923_c0_g1_i1.p1  ORF type:complete len:229 (+),score=66.13 TRINITY_DN1923_c0_g1_i1:63-749(+)